MAPWQHGSIRLRLALWDRRGGTSPHFRGKQGQGSHLMLTLGELPGLLGGDFVRFCAAIWSPSAPSAIWNHTAWWFQISMASTYCRLMFPNQMMPPTLEYSSTSIEHFFEGNLLEPARSGHQLFSYSWIYNFMSLVEKNSCGNSFTHSVDHSQHIYTIIHTIHLNQIPYMVLLCNNYITNIRSGICLYWDRVKQNDMYVYTTYAQLRILYDSIHKAVMIYYDTHYMYIYIYMYIQGGAP